MAAASRRLPRATAAAMRAEVGLRGRQQLPALPGALRREHRVPADDEALAREVGAADLDEVALVEQRQLQRALLDETPDGRCPQGARPVDAAHLAQPLDARGGRASPGRPRARTGLSAEAVAQLEELGLEGARVGGVATEGLHGHGAALGVGQQAEHHLGPVGPVVPAVAVGRERAAAALDPGGRHIEQDQAAGHQVPARERPLHGRLAGQQPVERAVQLVLRGSFHVHLRRERRGAPGRARWPASTRAPGCAPR